MTAKKGDKTTEAAVEQAQEKETEQGFRGVKVDPRPNEEYSLESGPDSPSAFEQRQDLAAAETNALTKSAE